MKTTVEFYMKGEAKSSQTFDTLKQAQDFMLALSDNPNCESYGIVRN